MPKDRSLVRASDIGLWHFCNRAWWLATVQSVDHENPAVLEAGTRAHTAHGRALHQAGWLRRAGLILVVLGVALFGLLLLYQFGG